MPNPPKPSATDALQKARELVGLRKKAAEESNAIGRHEKAAMEWKRESYVHFPSIHAELERVTAERDAALKGYRGMRSGLEEFAKLEPVNRDGEFDYESSNYDDECRKAVYFAERHVSVRAQNLLTSFPEIK